MLLLYFLFGLFTIFLLGWVMSLLFAIRWADSSLTLLACIFAAAWIITSFNIGLRLDKIDKLWQSESLTTKDR